MALFPIHLCPWVSPGIVDPKASVQTQQEELEVHPDAQACPPSKPIPTTRPRPLQLRLHEAKRCPSLRTRRLPQFVQHHALLELHVEANVPHACNARSLFRQTGVAWPKGAQTPPANAIGASTEKGLLKRQ